MREVDPFMIPADSKLILAPGGKHIMLMRLKAPLKAGSKFFLTLATKEGRVRAEVVVGSFGQISMPQ
jgi:copper(I)-binding protein